MVLSALSGSLEKLCPLSIRVLLTTRLTTVAGVPVGLYNAESSAEWFSERMGRDCVNTLSMRSETSKRIQDMHQDIRCSYPKNVTKENLTQLSFHKMRLKNPASPRPIVHTSTVAFKIKKYNYSL